MKGRLDEASVLIDADGSKKEQELQHGGHGGTIGSTPPRCSDMKCFRRPRAL
jgi:hypothetical protein